MKRKKLMVTNIILISLSAFFLIVTYFVYKKNLEINLNYYVPLMSVCVFLATFSICVLGWNSENKARFLLLSSAVIFSIFTIEVALYFLPMDMMSKKTQRQRMAEKQGIAFDVRNKFEIMTEMQENQQVAWPNISPEYFLENDGILSKKQKLFPVGAGISNAYTIVCNENGQFSHYHSDEFGFNNPKGIMQDKVHTMIIGDSFAHGACVNEGFDITSFLRKHWQPKTVNLGTSGIGPLVELATLTEYGSVLKPKRVLWLYFEGNDLSDLAQEIKSAYLMNYLNDNFTQKLFYKQKQIDEALINYMAIKKKDFNLLYKPQRPALNLISILKLRSIRSQFGLNTQQAPEFLDPKGVFEAILAAANRRVQAWGGELIFVYLPELERFNVADKDKYNKSRYRSEVMDIVSNMGIKTIDLVPVFSEKTDPSILFPFGIEGHYTEQGYELVANEIIKQMNNSSKI